MQYNEGSWHNPAPAPSQTLTSTLANPYFQTALTNSAALSMQYPYTVSSHYAQAYLPKQNVPPRHPHGFGAARASQLAPPSYSRQFGGGAPTAGLGEARCTYEGCTFTGSQTTVEVHMMDRHLIFPSGWTKKRKADWDADPSLIGKVIPIQGTNITLDTPEALVAWIAERKKRWPTAARIVERQQREEEAAARGQLNVGVLMKPNKKPRLNAGAAITVGKTQEAQRLGQLAHAWKTVTLGQRNNSQHTKIKSFAAQTSPAPVAVHDEASSGSDMDETKHAVSSKVAPSYPLALASQSSFSPHEGTHVTSARPIPRPPNPAPHEPRPPRAYFNNRPSLLRNLLLPEICTTVSNVSQAIRFLVDNNFLDDVELNAGEAAEKIVEVLSEEHPTRHT